MIEGLFPVSHEIKQVDMNMAVNAKKRNICGLFMGVVSMFVDPIYELSSIGYNDDFRKHVPMLSRRLQIIPKSRIIHLIFPNFAFLKFCVCPLATVYFHHYTSLI